MKNIMLSKRRFEQLEPLQLPKEVLNTEGLLYNFTYKGKEKVLKKLYSQSGRMFANKLYTLEMLDDNKQYLPDNFYIPDYLVTVSGKVQGFTIPKNYGITLSTLLKTKDMKTEEQIYYLKKVGEILKQLSTIRKYTALKDIYLNDIHEANFMVDTTNKSLSVIDLDSCKIGTNDQFPARYLTAHALLNNVSKKYNIIKNSDMEYVVADENSDLYCYNIMIMNYLYGKNINNLSIGEFYSYITYLDNIGVNGNLLDCFERLVINKTNKNPEGYLETLTNEDVYRAKESVYKGVRRSN